jgi:alanyl aminopeptidase
VSLDSGLRLQVVGALAAISTLQQAADMRSMALNSPHLRANEVMQMLRNHMRRAELRPQTWSFIKQNFLALKARLPEKDGANLAALTGQFCDAQSAQDAQAFFAPYINELAGGPRALAMAQEAIGLCTAQREAQTPGVRRFFENLK